MRLWPRWPGPVLIDGATNEFRFLDPPVDSVPLQVPVIAGQTFVVAIEFLNQQAQGNPFVPSVEYDADGCQAGVNAVFTIPGGWADACLAGVPGDFGIRAIVNPIPEPATFLVMMAGGLSMLLKRRRPVLVASTSQNSKADK